VLCVFVAGGVAVQKRCCVLCVFGAGSVAVL